MRFIQHSCNGRARHAVSSLGLSLILLTGGYQASMAQTTYYVAASGSDNNNGRAPDTPFQTVGKVNSISLQAGDQVLFRRGDTFRGTLQVRQSGTSGQPIVIDAYGSGNKPVLAGSVPLAGWSNQGNNIWQANASALGNRVSGLYRNGSALPLGRFPNLDAANRGYLTVQSHDGKVRFDSKEELGGIDWTGAEAVIRPVQWILDRATITKHNGRTLWLTNNSSYYINDNWGFFIQNHPATLDQPGEWYYNPANKTIRLYSDSDPNGQTITATLNNEAVNLVNVSNVTIRNVAITQALATNLLADNCSNLQLSGLDLTNAGEDGLVIRGGGNGIVVENSLIQDINNNGVNIGGYQNVTFRGNLVQRIGLVPGLGKSGDGTYTGFQSSSYNNTIIESNVFDQIGYNGINFANNTVIQRNRVSNFCLTKSDGGGIYIWNGNRQGMSGVRIVKNLVFNGMGTSEGSPGGAYSGANGIYLDDCTANMEVADNSVFNCKGLGIFLHGSSSIRLTGNTSYNNGEAQLSMTSITNGCSPRSNVIDNNILVGRVPEQLLAKYESHLNDLGNYGQFSNNVYARPFNDNFKIRIVYSLGAGLIGADQGLTEWQGRSGQDGNSQNSPVLYNPYVLAPVGSLKLSNQFNGGNDGWGTWGPYNNGQAFGDNAGRLDGGSLCIGFPNASGKGDSYVLAWNGIGGVSQGKTYQVKFDAVASSGNKRVEVFLRQRNGPYNDLAPRSVISVGGSRQSYELGFTATANEGDALLVMQVVEDGQMLNVDNVQVQEATKTTRNPDDYIRLEYNDSGQEKTVALGASYRDARSPNYTNQVTLAPYSSVVLFRENGATAPAPVTLRDPENPANAVPGLDYNYYESALSQVSDMNSLSPTRTGTVTQPDLLYRLRDDAFGFQFKGYVNVPTDGQYTFYTYSDDGSKLFIGSTEVVNNDGGHAEQERSGSIGLKAGRHAITIPYFEGGGGQALSVSYSGPGIDKQPIPASAFFRVGSATPPPPPIANLRDPENPANAVPGLDYSYYEQMVSQVSDLNNLTPTKTGTASLPDLSTPRNRDDAFGLQFRGFVNVPTNGDYTFFVSSDDGSKLFIGSTQVVDNDGGHDVRERSGSIGLKAGRHAITIPYFEAGGGQALSVSYSGPGINKQTIPASAFFRLNTTTTPAPQPQQPTANLRDPENPNNAVPGLDYNYYEQMVSQVSDLNTLTPTKTGTANQMDLSLRSRDDAFGFQFKGYVNVPTDGQYTFYTYSDDGSKLFIGSTEVVNNDGGHAEQERSGTIGLKAGRHAITVPYFEGGGGQALVVSYSGPGIGKQPIPASAFFRVGTTTTPTPQPVANLRDPENPANAVQGLDYSYYEGSWSQLPNFNALPSVRAGVTSVPDLSTPRNRDDAFGLQFRGFVNVPTNGDYTFFVSSDDGSKLFIGSTQVVDNDGGHDVRERSGSIGLKAGRHAITIPYFEAGGGQALSVSYSGPGINKQTIPASAFFRVNTGQPAAGTGTGLWAVHYNNKTLNDPSVLSRVDATVNWDWGTGSPARGTVNVDNFSIRWTGQVEAPVSGNYIFTTTADDGVRLWVNDNLIVNNWTDQWPTTTNSPGIALVGGQKYNIRMEYYDSGVGAVARLLWSYPGQAQQVIPQQRLYPANSGARQAAEFSLIEPALQQETQPSVEVYPLPAHEQLTVRFYASQAGQASLHLSSLTGATVLSQTHTHPSGSQTLQVAVGPLARGYYLLTLLHNGQRTVRKVLLID